MRRNFRGRIALLAPLMASGLLVSGCMGSPTYGTGTTSNAQLTSDLSSMFSMKRERGGPANYKPRPELVKPASTTELPLPQDNVTSVSPAWPESPEEKRARLLAETSANQDNNNAEPLIINDMAVATERRKGFMSPSQLQDEDAKPMSNRDSRSQREEYNRRLAESSSSPTSRRYLSEPPLEYRVPADTAPTGDVGEDEKKKQRRLKREASGGGSWRDLVPWL